MLRKFADNIWIADQSLTFFGLEMGARMTVVAIDGTKDLLIHSPIRPTDELLTEIDRLGIVKHILAPNLFHHLYIDGFKQNYPEAKLYCAPGIETKRSDIQFDEVIEEDKEYPWSHVAEHHLVLGCPRSNEVVLFFRDQKTLLVTDLGINIHENSPWMTRTVFKAMGMFKTFGWSRFEKWLFIRDRDRFAASTAKILRWDFDKIILSHGQLVQDNGRSLFSKAFGEPERI